VNEIAWNMKGDMFFLTTGNVHVVDHTIPRARCHMCYLDIFLQVLLKYWHILMLEVMVGLGYLKDYYLLSNEKKKFLESKNLEDPSLYHYAIFF
ncbi:hypothetical protein Tco_0761392, partial [Tanacetum coccineum]